MGDAHLCRCDSPEHEEERRMAQITRGMLDEHRRYQERLRERRAAGEVPAGHHRVASFEPDDAGGYIIHLAAVPEES